MTYNLRRRAARISATLFLLVFALGAFAQQRQPDGQYLQKFEYKAEGNPQRVNVAGDFNNWSSDANAMTKEGDVWRTSVPMSKGIHHYKFVIDGNRWVNDPKADKILYQGMATPEHEKAMQLYGQAMDRYRDLNTFVPVGNLLITVIARKGVGGISSLRQGNWTLDIPALHEE